MKLAKTGLVIAVILSISFFIFLRNKGAKASPKDAIGRANSSELAAQLAPNTPVAKVNSSAITAEELQEEFDRRLPPTVSHGHTDDKQKAALRKTALDELVIRELACQKAKAMGLQADPTEMNATIAKIKGRYKSEKNFEEALRADQITEKEFAERIEKDLLLRKIHKLEIDDKAVVSDSEVRNYYNQNIAKFVRPESIRLWAIVVKSEAKKEASAKKKIDEAFRKLKAGESFDAVAYKYSEDDYRVMGGDYGSIHRGQLDPELETIAFGAKLKALTGPVQTSFGWHILRVENRESERQMKFEEVKGKITSSMHQKRMEQRKTEFARELKAGAKIEYAELR